MQRSAQTWGYSSAAAPLVQRRDRLARKGLVALLAFGMAPALSASGAFVATRSFSGDVDGNGIQYSYNIGQLNQVAPGVGFAITGITSNGNYSGSGTTTATDSVGDALAETVTTSVTDPPYNSSSIAKASLYSGSVGVQASGTGNGTFGGVASSYAQATDSLTFTVAGANASSVTYVPVTYTVDGSVGTSDGGTGSGSVDLVFGNASFGQGVGADGSIGTADVSGWYSYELTSNTADLIIFNGLYEIDGASATLGISEYMAVGANVGAELDYSNTAAVSFNLPSDVSFTSESGVFDTAVPEPASGLLIGAIVAAIFPRRRRDGGGFNR